MPRSCLGDQSSRKGVRLAPDTMREGDRIQTMGSVSETGAVRSAPSNLSEALYRIALGEKTHPYLWQHRFAATEWPEVLIAPTGSGKTAGVTLGWAARRMRAPNSTPRRLVWCLPMRTLVEQTAHAIEGWFGTLIRTGVDENGTLPRPNDIHVLMGGVETAGWLEVPERPAVIIGTQDMLLSRALMRGYASSRAIWPMEFALLHEDAQWVFDEVQLMDAGRATSAQLEAFRRLEFARATKNGSPLNHPARSLWISATLEPEWLRTVDFQVSSSAVVVVDAKMEEDERLMRLTSATKTVRRSDVVPASEKSSDIDAYMGDLAHSVLDDHRPGKMTLVIVNQVKRAQTLHTLLGEKLHGKEGTAPDLVLVHARFRPPDRRREIDKILMREEDANPGGRIVVATQAVEAGVDISAAVLFTELAPWPSMVQRFGRANRYAELPEGAEIHWIDLLGDRGEDDKEAVGLASPYSVADLMAARQRMSSLTDAAPVNLPKAGSIDPPQRIIRRRDLDDLFDTDPDLTGFDVDVSPYIRDTQETDIRVFWRDLRTIGGDPPRPRGNELCAVPIGAAKTWISKARKKRKPGESTSPFAFVRDPQWRRVTGRTGHSPPGWMPLQGAPWPGVTLLVNVTAGGYDEVSGFTGAPKDVPKPLVSKDDPDSGNTTSRNPDAHEGGEGEEHGEDPWSGIGVAVPLVEHLGHVAEEAETLCDALDVDPDTQAFIVRAARWHDLGKAHEVFQQTMRRGLDQDDAACDILLAKTKKTNLRHERPFFRHELASALALLAHEQWSREADLVAYLIVAHHGKVRMNLRALPREPAPPDGDGAKLRFARGIREDDELSPFDLGGGEKWEGGHLTLSVMELGWDEITRESWTERTRDLLAKFGPFRLAWMETLVRLADWRASAKERETAS